MRKLLVTDKILKITDSFNINTAGRVIPCFGKEEYFKQIKKLCAVKKVVGYDLIRAGESNDGGYVMLNDFNDDCIGYSFGIGQNIEWDKWIARNRIQVHCFDHTIDFLPEKNDRLIFHKIGISGYDYPEKRLLSMNSILRGNGHINKDNILLKMDVEGAEWDFIENTSSSLLRKFIQITFELHGIASIRKGENRKRVLDGLKKINRTHQAVWVHGNNVGGAIWSGGIIMPRFLEITYVNKEYYTFKNVEYNCPLNIDRPNHKEYKDIVLKRWGV